MRFYCESINAGSVEPDQVELHHMTGVMRVKPGERVELFDGQGTVAQAKAVSTGKKSVSLEIIETVKIPPRQTSRITILVSVAKGDRFERLIAGCTELGVDIIVPTIFSRTVKQPKGRNSIDRYRKIAIASSKQCRRAYLPQISEPLDFPTALAECVKDKAGAEIIFGSLTAGAESIVDCTFEDKDVCVFIGPEGGLTESEEKMLIDSGAKPVRLTGTVLRIETAATAAAAFLTIRRDSKNEQSDS